MQRYRRGHNEAVLKTVCPLGTWVRIPPSASEIHPVHAVYLNGFSIRKNLVIFLKNVVDKYYFEVILYQSCVSTQHNYIEN